MKDADGKDIEVFTAEEVKAQQEQALEDYKKEHPDKSVELAAAETARTDAEKKLADALAAGGDTKDENIRALRTAVQTANTAAEDAKKTALAAVAAAQNIPTQEYKSTLLETVTRSDKTLGEKVDIAYKALQGMPEGSKQEVRARMEAALRIASDTITPNIFDGGTTSMGNRGVGGMAQNGIDENDNSKAIRSVLGITDEQAKKYSPQVGQPGYVAPKN